jgi:hypothetical protein
LASGENVNFGKLCSVYNLLSKENENSYLQNVPDFFYVTLKGSDGLFHDDICDGFPVPSKQGEAFCGVSDL